MTTMRKKVERKRRVDRAQRLGETALGPSVWWSGRLAILGEEGERGRTVEKKKKLQ